MELRIHVEGDDRLAASARRALARVEGIVITDHQSALVLRRGSRVRPTLTLDGPIVDDERARAATRLGGSILAWEGRDHWSHWERCFVPITARPLRGAPEPTRRWILVDDGELERIPARAEAAWQWHALVRAPVAAPDHIVQWPLHARIAAPLLGAASAVLGSDGPLVDDARRLRRPVLQPTSDTPIDAWQHVAMPSCSARLARAIPPMLLEMPGFWESLVAAASAREGVAPIMDADHLRAARDAAALAGRGPWGSTQRALRRLGEDPSAAARDARLWLVRKLWSSARTPTVQANSSRQRP